MVERVEMELSTHLESIRVGMEVKMDILCSRISWLARQCSGAQGNCQTGGKDREPKGWASMEGKEKART